MILDRFRVIDGVYAAENECGIWTIQVFADAEAEVQEIMHNASATRLEFYSWGEAQRFVKETTGKARHGILAMVAEYLRVKFAIAY